MTPPTPRRPLVTAARISLRVLVGLVVVGAALYAFRDALFGRALRGRLEEELSKAAGMPVTIGAIEGGWITDLTLVDVRAGVGGAHPAEAAGGAGSTPSRPGALRRLTVARAEAEYGFPAVLRDPLTALRGVRVTGLEIEIDPSARDSSTGADATTPHAWTEVLDAVLPEIPHGSIDGRVVIAVPGTPPHVWDVSASIAGRGIQLDAHDDAGRALRVVTMQHLPGTATTRRDVDAKLTGPNGSARLQADGDAITISTETFDLTSVPEWVRVVAGVTGDDAPSGGVVTATLRLPRVTGASAGQAHAKVHAEGLTLRGRTIDRLDAEVAGAGTTWTLARLSAEVPSGSVETQAVRIDTSKRMPVLAAGRTDIRTADLAALVAFVGTQRGPSARNGMEPEVHRGPPDLRAARRPVALVVPDTPRRVPDGVLLTLGVSSFADGVAAIDELAATFRGTRVVAAGTVSVPADAATPHDVTLALRIRADADLADARDLFEGDELPESAGVVHAEGDIAGPLDDPSFTGSVAGASLTIGGHAVATLAFTGTAGSTRIEATQLLVSGAALDVNARGGLDLATRAVDGLACDVVVRDLAAVGEMLPGAPPLAGSGEAHVVADGTLPAASALRGPEWRTALRTLTFRATARLTGVSVDGDALGDGTVAASLAWPRLEIAQASFTSPDAKLRLDGAEADLDARTGRLEHLYVHATDAARLRRWIAVPKGVSGSVEVQARADKVAGDGWNGLSGTASVAVGGFSWRGNPYGELKTDVVWRDGTGTFKAAASGLWGDAAAAGTATMEADGSIAGTLQSARFRREADTPVRRRDPRPERADGPPQAADASHPATSASHRSVVLAGPALFRVGGDRVEVSGADAEAFGGRLRGGVVLDGERIDAEVAFEGVDLAGLDEHAAGRASGRLAVHGPPESPDFSLEAEVTGAGWRGLDDGRVALRAEQSGGTLELRSLDADFGPVLTLHAEARLPWTFGSSGFVASAAIDPHLVAKAHTSDGVRVSSAFPAVGVAFTEGDAEITARGTTLKGRATLTGVRWTRRPRDASVLSATTIIAVDADASRTTFSIATAPGADATFRGDVVLGAGIDWSRPRKTWDAVRDAPLSGSITASVPDIAPLRPLIPGAAEVHGSVDARLELAGTTLNPEARGRLAADDLAVRFDNDLPPVTDGSLVMTFDGRDARLESLRARLGYGDVEASGTMSAGGAEGPVVDLRLTGKNALLTRGQYLRVRSDLDLHVSGPVAALVVKGDARVTDAVWSQPMSVSAASIPQSGETFTVFTIEDEPLRSLRFDVHVVADRTIHAENDLLHGTLSADVQLRGTGARPEPEGTVVVEEGRVTLPFTELRVVHGEIAFPRGRPLQPRIDAAARARIQGFDTTVRISGEVASASVHVFTDPPLSRQEAMLLVSTGASPAELERSGVSGVAFQRAGMLLGEELVTLFSGRGDPVEESAFDRFSVEIGTDVSRSGADTVDARFALTERFFLRGVRDRYDDYAVGFLWRFEFR